MATRYLQCAALLFLGGEGEVLLLGFSSRPCLVVAAGALGMTFLAELKVLIESWNDSDECNHLGKRLADESILNDQVPLYKYLTH
ncbi:hypothetical protein JOM56_010396 [Amanita muscaria]